MKMMANNEIASKHFYCNVLFNRFNISMTTVFLWLRTRRDLGLVIIGLHFWREEMGV